MNILTLYEIRTLGIDENVDVSDVLDFIQDDFIVSRQTAKKMLKPDTLLVYHLDREDAEKYIQRFKAHGLICKIVQMVRDDPVE